MSSVVSATDRPARVATASVIPLVPAWRIDAAWDYIVPDHLVEEIVVGSLVRVPFGGRRVRGVVTAVGGPAVERRLEAIAGVVFPGPIAPPPQDQLLDWIARRYLAPRGLTFRLAVPPRVRVVRPVAGHFDAGPAPEGTLGFAGGRELVAAIAGGRPGCWCFQTHPGADRAALIAELVAAAVRADGAALVAVPEVRYGSAVIETLQTHWPNLARIDSSVNDLDRSRAVAELAAGARVGAGGRATVLAPARNLRLIVVDEDHHPTYKEERSPRYDARRVVVERASLARAVCVFVGSTPSVEVGHAALTGASGLVLPSRAADRQNRPIVEVVEPAPDRALSRALHRRVRDVLQGGGRVALLAPRRGYSRTVWCAACRRSLRCPVCEAGLGYDRAASRVRCPRCGRTQAPPDRCPGCRATEWRFIGAGSERLADQIATTWPGARVVRMDPDVLEAAAGRPRPDRRTGGQPGPYHDTDGRGPDLGRADIYVTTWIGTKPELRPEVSLVAVLDGDGLIRRPDFRAAERAFQALAELSEWAGPASEGGRLMIQTSEARHHAVQAIVRADYRYFLEREIAFRHELGYPPFSELIKMTIAGKRGPEAVTKVTEVCRREGARVLGPIAVRGKTEPTLQLLFKCDEALAVAEALRPVVAALAGETRVAVDVDPR